MNELNTLLNELIKEKGGSVKDYKNLLKSIAYHESAHTLDPKIRQRGGGPGRGKYQFEEGKNSGGITAARRTKKYFDSKGISSPEWLEKALKEESLDATKLSSDAQDVLFLGNMRMHPKADFKKVWEGKETVSDFWANYHWAGNPKDRNKRLKSFNISMEDLESKPSYEIPTNQEFQSSTFESPTMFAQGGDLQSYVKQKFSNNTLNSFNAGGLHETNPYGGIPQGTGSNGQMNTVEQGETSFNLPQGKFIFSDRINTKGTINQFADGGLIDPPNKKVENGKSFVNNWFDNPVTKAKLSMNLNQGLKKSNEQITSGLNNLNKVDIRMTDAVNDTTKASYTPYDNQISFYTEPTDKMATHEYTHAMGTIDNDLSSYIKRNYGAIPLDKGEDYNERSHIKYINRKGELYSRIMELRQHLGVKPGDEINDDQIKTLKDDNVNELMKYYEPDQIKSMLNTLASNSSTSNVNTAALGGVQNSNCGGPGQPPCKEINNPKLFKEKDFFNDYLKSEVYISRLKTQGHSYPEIIRNTRLDKLKDMESYVGDYPREIGSQYINHNNSIMVNTNEVKEYKDDVNTVIAHETSHGLGAKQYDGEGHAFRLNKNETSEINDRNKETSIEHDGRAHEVKADLDALRYKLFNDKIYDTKIQKFDQNYLNKAKKKYKNNTFIKRLFDRLDDENLIYLMNNIASNKNNTKNNLT